MTPEVFFVTTVIPTRAGFATMAVVTEFDSLADLNAALIEDRTVYCAQLMFEKDGPRSLTGVRPCILGQATIASIVPHYDQISPDQLNALLEDFDRGADTDDDDAEGNR
jgi:hypothetical protein